jgi:hypothetical protein
MANSRFDAARSSDGVGPGWEPYGAVTRRALTRAALLDQCRRMLRRTGRASRVAGGRMLATPFAFALVSCAGDTSAPPMSVSVAAAIEVVSGHGQAARAGMSIERPVVVRVTDQAGRPVRGAIVHWSTDDGTLDTEQSTTTTAGVAEVRWTLPGSAGPATAYAGVSNIPPAAIRAWAVSSGPATLQISDGASQTAPATTALPVAPTVFLLDSAGIPMPGQAVTFRVRSGNGWLASAHALTDSTGQARADWYLGPRENIVNELEAISGPGLSVTFSARADPLEPGRSYFGRVGYIEYIPGDLPIVLAVPHGGTLQPDEIPERPSGSTSSDANTIELALAAADAFLTRTGGRPHIIICHLDRARLDANRDLSEAAAARPEAELAWREFHAFIDAAKLIILEQHGAGFFADIHGHGHAAARLELGYELHGGILEMPDSLLDQPALVALSSIRGLVEQTQLSLPALLRGPLSLGALFDARGYLSVPGSVFPHPQGLPYFAGGYNTHRHGSRNGGRISGVQIETPWPGVRDTEQNRAAFGRAMAAVFDEFVALHFGWPARPITPAF